MTKKNSFEKKLRIILFLFAGLLHAALLFFVVFQIEKAPDNSEPVANVISLVDVREERPPPPPPREIPPEIFTNTVEAIAETMIETDEEPPDIIYENIPVPVREEVIDYVPMSRVTDLPRLPEDQIKRAVIYPPIAQRSNIEGWVYLELFVDRQGAIRNITILKEEPENRGFGEAAVSAFKGIKAEKPAQVNGEAVAVRYRYRMVFTLK
ncbi:MAG: energy transducer TonB [Treponema sp.]|jgi:protein TonB|nr:energy transducer TonB [Treponema sp.]